MATTLNELVDEIWDFWDSESGHDYRQVNGDYVCECGVNLGPASDYVRFEVTHTQHHKEVVKGIIVAYLDNQKDWDAEAAKVFGI